MSGRGCSPRCHQSARLLPVSSAGGASRPLAERTGVTHCVCSRFHAYPDATTFVLSADTRRMRIASRVGTASPGTLNHPHQIHGCVYGLVVAERRAERVTEPKCRSSQRGTKLLDWDIPLGSGDRRTSMQFARLSGLLGSRGYICCSLVSRCSAVWSVRGFVLFRASVKILSALICVIFARGSL